MTQNELIQLKRSDPCNKQVPMVYLNVSFFPPFCLLGSRLGSLRCSVVRFFRWYKSITMSGNSCPSVCRDVVGPCFQPGVTKTRNGKRNGMENGMKRIICIAIYVYLRKMYLHYLCMNHPSFPLIMLMYYIFTIKQYYHSQG